MDSKIIVRISVILFAVMAFTGCSSTSHKDNMAGATRSNNLPGGIDMSLVNSSNIQLIDNPIVMFHDFTVNQTPEGTELEGKIHVKNHVTYVPGHIDIAVVDKKTGNTIQVESVNFNQHLARHGHSNLMNENNFTARLPDIIPDAVTIYVAYHNSNIDRFSQIDCGSNAAVTALNVKSGISKRP